MLPTIVDAIKKHDNNSSALQFFENTIHEAQCVKSLWKIKQGMLIEWIATNGQLKPYYIHVVELNTTMTSNKKNITMLKE